MKKGVQSMYSARTARSMSSSTRVPVKLGYMDGEWAEVRSGIKQGEQVVIAGKTALRDGTEVQVIGQPGAKSDGSTPATATAQR